MLRFLGKVTVLALMISALASIPTYARGGRGGGGMGGGGMRGGGGGMGGGGMRGGGGFSHSPSFSVPRAGGGVGGARPGAGVGGGVRPGAGVGSGARPGAGVGSGARPGAGVGGGVRPGGGVGSGARPGGGPGIGDRPGIGGGSGIGNRPGIGDRPGIGGGPAIGDRPGIGGGVGGVGNRPGIDNRPGLGGGVGGIGNRPGIDNRPGLGGGVGGIGDRPGIDNRPGLGGGQGIGNRVGGGAIGNNTGIGGNTNINLGGVNTGGFQQANVGAIGGYGGYGAGLPAYNNWRGAYAGYHRGWTNGYWHGYHNNAYWNWGNFALGAVAGVTAWGLGSSLYSWGYAPYANPYYSTDTYAQPIVVEQVVADGAPQTITVPAVSYDYSQPINTQAPPPEAAVADPALAKFDEGRAAFKAGDYVQALKRTDEAIKTLPNDATLHEFRALALFALQKYEQAATPLHAVLSVGPGWDWTTLIGLYPRADVYTQQLRALEQYARSNPKSTAAHFLLAYHYLTQGHNDAALGQFRQIQALAPGDTLSAQLVKQLARPDETPAATPTPATSPAASAGPTKEAKLTGRWTARPGAETDIDLDVKEDGTFTWKVTAKGKTQVIAGDWSRAAGILTLAQGNQGGALVGNVTWQDANRFQFRAIGTTPEDPGLLFTR
jgi:tetratricopeptide (TPR) repeat protein